MTDTPEETGSEIVNLSDHTPMTGLFTVTVFRKVDGTLFLRMDEAQEAFFEETKDLEVAERMRHLQRALEASLPSIEMQAELCHE